MSLHNGHISRTSGKYLGFMIGPASANTSWDKPVRKYMDRAALWATLHLGLHFNTLVYRVFVASVLTFVMQLEPDPPELMDAFGVILRRLAPGPGNWISRGDATHLSSAYSFPLQFSDPRWVALACKIRVVRDVAHDCEENILS
jgi:hypothetical protein